MIHINNLSFSYPKHEVFRSLTFTLEGGNVYGLLGQNGVGKTTLLKILAGLLRSNKEACRVNGCNPYKRQPAFLREVYYLPEEPACPPGTVNDFARCCGGFYPRFDLGQFYGLLDRFGIQPLARFKDLSAGQQKKAHISYAIALNTSLLLLDEPSNGMDIPSKSLFRSVVSQHITPERVLIISTHQVRDLENLIDPVIILDKKGVVLHATIDEIAQKLYFFRDVDEDPSALYAEEVPAGYSMVRSNTAHHDSKVDLEILFNAALLHRDWFTDHFKK